MKVNFYKHSLQEEDVQNVVKILGSDFLTTGPVTAEFENIFSRYTGLKYAIALSSCTAALHLALLALKIGPGDEVITTQMTFIATATAILHTGAKPVFIDIEPDTGLIDPSLVESAVTSRTKAIVPVHLYGKMTDMRALRQIADRYDLFIVEDSSHCIEGEREGVRPGDLSDAACYSFYATKNLTCGEGGALATNNKDLARKVRLMRQHGMSKEAADRHHGIYQHWDMIELGWKYNLDDIRAALLIHQIDRLPFMWEKRKSLYEYYIKYLKNITGLHIPSVIGRSAYHLFTILVPPKRRDMILSALGQHGIGVAVNYRSIHTLSYFRKTFNFKPEDFPIANRIGNSTISLPFYPKLEESEIDYIVGTIRNLMINRF